MSHPLPSPDAYDPFSREAMSDPFPLYQALRERGPLHPLPRYDGFALPRFAEVWQVLGDAERFSVAEGPVFFPQVVSQLCDVEKLVRAAPARSFSTWDPPLHTRLRALMSASFRPKVAAALEDEARRIARSCLDACLPTGRLDVVGDYAAHVAVRLVCLALGIEASLGPRFVALSNRTARRSDGQAGMSEDGLAAQAEIMSLLEEQVRLRRNGRDSGGIVDALLAFELEGRRFSDSELATQLATLLVGGSETVPKIVAGGLRELAGMPEAIRALRASPELVAGAFEEMVRHQGVLQSVGRTALVDLELAGQRVRHGQRLFLLLQSANRDAREFPDPDRLDVHRRPPRHVGFGFGPHHCIGIHLARLEGRVLLEELLARVPEWHVDEAGVQRPPSEFQIGYTRLPIEFRPVA
ncbi:cytochrome P450 [Myxococcota bacterium]|nr:cytochrome P450 [Myxococcota bacterium]